MNAHWRRRRNIEWGRLALWLVVGLLAVVWAALFALYCL